MTKVTIAALESKVEKDCVDWAQSQGWLTMKYTGERGYPDRIFIKGGATIWVELKREGNEPTKAQRYKIRKLKEAGADAYWTDSLEGLQTILESLDYYQP
jgi:hypothetical protein